MKSRTEPRFRSIRLVEDLPASPERVWRALTDPQRIARWLMPNDFQPVVGHRFRFHGAPIPAVRFGGTVECEVLAVATERMLRYTWCDVGTENGLRSTVTWYLEPLDGGTRLTLEHDGFDPENDLQELAWRIMSGGWVGVMRRLAEAASEPVELP